LDGIPLINAKAGQRGSVIHIEDEPESVYATLVELGIFPGMELRVLAIEPNRIRILLEGSEKELDALEAANVTLGPFAENETDFASARRLSDLKPGERGKVLMISKASRGNERRRFMDLGLLPGTVVAAELESPGGDPVAYRVRGALLALRRDQAEHILITPQGNAEQ
jgi:DtxR family Mn-dependent transcriptional regulator